MKPSLEGTNVEHTNPETFNTDESKVTSSIMFDSRGSNAITFHKE